MPPPNGNSAEMGGNNDASKSKSRLVKIVGFIVMVAIIAAVIAVIVVFSGNEGGAAGTVDAPSTAGPSTPVYTTTTTASPVTTPAPTAAPGTETTTDAPSGTTTSAPQTSIELEDFLNGTFSSPTFGTWVSGNEVIYTNDVGDLVIYDVLAETATVLISRSSELLQSSSRFTQLSPDRSKVALAINADGVYRHSFLAQYAVIDVVTQDVVYIDVTTSNTTRNTSGVNLQNFQWGPTGTALAYVFENNIYYQADITSEPRLITSTGEKNVIFNGVPDWVYEEEVFSTYNALWFSNDGNKIAYATFNDSDVRIMWVPHYGVPGSIDAQYTIHNEIRYPKPGTTNPTVTVTLFDLQNDTSVTFSGPVNLDQPILNQVQFVSSDTIAVVWTNRVQNAFRVELCTSLSTSCTAIYEYTQVGGWLDIIPLRFNEGVNAFLTILPQTVGGTLYRQIVQISDSNANSWTPQGRTNTTQTVLSILYWGSDNTIWYTATSETEATEQHVFTVDAAGQVSCFTCGIINENGDECLYNSATVNPTGELISITCSGPGVPQIFVYNTSGTRVSTWNDNQEVSSLVISKALPRRVIYSVPLGDGIQNADVLIQVPADVENMTNVPLLVYVYGGPNTARVTRQWSVDWGSTLVSRWGIAVAQIDGRGSSRRGVDNMFTVNRRLGTYEIEDQITVTRWLQASLGWVDANRTCIWGSSYGGYAASHALAKGGDVFRCAIALAPVTDWKYYDTIYTERYMDTPQNNPEGYAAGSLLTTEVVEAFRNKSYFLGHGTEDDNVHFQHTMLLSRLLQRNNVAFEQMSYIDENHSLSGVSTHLYHTLEKFLEENLL